MYLLRCATLFSFNSFYFCKWTFGFGPFWTRNKFVCISKIHRCSYPSIYSEIELIKRTTKLRQCSFSSSYYYPNVYFIICVCLLKKIVWISYCILFSITRLWLRTIPTIDIIYKQASKRHCDDHIHTLDWYKHTIYSINKNVCCKSVRKYFCGTKDTAAHSTQHMLGNCSNNCAVS